MIFQESSSFCIENVIFFHDFSIVLVIFISVLSGYFILSCLVNSSFDVYTMDKQGLEFIWTVFPVFLLFFLAVPSIQVLYSSEESFDLVATFNITGHQWFWSYGFDNWIDETECYMELSGISRLLNTSDILVLPVLAPVRGLVSSADVIHAWSLPSMGVNVDAVPGRLNQVFLYSTSSCLVSGQCSEICGGNHSFMPIVSIFI